MNVHQAKQILDIDPAIALAPTALKSAFRRKARQVHPDICGSETSCAQFIAVQQAFDLLSRRVAATKSNRSLTASVRAAYRRGVRHRPIEVDFDAIEALLSDREWHILKYCATYAADFSIQSRATTHLANAGRLADLLDIAKASGPNQQQRLALVLGLLETRIAGIVAAAPRDRDRLAELLLSNTHDALAASRLLAILPKPLPRISRFASAEVARIVAGRLAAQSRWVELRQLATRARALGDMATYQVFTAAQQGAAIAQSLAA